MQNNNKRSRGLWQYMYKHKSTWWFKRPSFHPPPPPPPNSPTQKLSERLGIILSPLFAKLQTYKDDWDILLQSPNNTGTECIPRNWGIKALTYVINKYPELISKRFKDFIIDATLFTSCFNNNFMFSDQMCHQETGTAMWTKFAPHYACLAIGLLEENDTISNPATTSFYTNTVRSNH